MGLCRLLGFCSVLHHCVPMLYLSVVPSWPRVGVLVRASWDSPVSSPSNADAAVHTSPDNGALKSKSPQDNVKQPPSSTNKSHKNTHTPPAPAAATPLALAAPGAEPCKKAGPAGSNFQPTHRTQADSQQGSRAPRRLAAWNGPRTSFKRLFSKKIRQPPVGRGREALRAVAQKVHLGTMPCTFPESHEPEDWLPLISQLRKLLSPEQWINLEEAYPSARPRLLQVGRRLRSHGPCVMFSIDTYGRDVTDPTQWALEVYAVPGLGGFASKKNLFTNAVKYALEATSALTMKTPESLLQETHIMTPYSILKHPETLYADVRRIDGSEVAGVFVMRKRTRVSLDLLIDVRNSEPTFVDRNVLIPALLSATHQAMDLIAHVHSLQKVMKDLEASDFHVASDGTLYLDASKITRLDKMVSVSQSTALRRPPEIKSGYMVECTSETDRWQLGFVLYQLWCDVWSGVDELYRKYAAHRDPAGPLEVSEACMREMPNAVRRIMVSFLQKSPSSRVDSTVAVRTAQYKELLQHI